MQRLVRRKSCISQIFALCDFWAISFHYWDLPYANFGLFLQLNKYETPPYFIQLTQNLTLDCLLV